MSLERSWRRAFARRVWPLLPEHVQLRIFGTVSEYGLRWVELQTMQEHKAADRFMLEHGIAERIGEKREYVVLTELGEALRREGLRA